jgi:isocitrate lyase
LAGKVLVPFQDQISRLIATRLQWDIMGVSNIIIARTDSESGKLLSSDIDPRDHEFLLGVADVNAKQIKSQSRLLYELEMNGATADEINAAETEWTESHPLLTFTQGISFHLNTNDSRQKQVWQPSRIQQFQFYNSRQITPRSSPTRPNNIQRHN